MYTGVRQTSKNQCTKDLLILIQIPKNTMQDFVDCLFLKMCACLHLWVHTLAHIHTFVHMCLKGVIYLICQFFSSAYISKAVFVYLFKCKYNLSINASLNWHHDDLSSFLRSDSVSRTVPYAHPSHSHPNPHLHLHPPNHSQTRQENRHRETSLCWRKLCSSCFAWTKNPHVPRVDVQLTEDRQTIHWDFTSDTAYTPPTFAQPSVALAPTHPPPHAPLHLQEHLQEREHVRPTMELTFCFMFSLIGHCSLVVSIWSSYR